MGKVNWKNFFKENPRANKLLFGVETLPTKLRVVLVLLTAFYLGTGMYFGYVYGFTEGSGTPPWVKARAITPPSDLQLVTSEEATEFVKEDKTNLEKYDIGFNCVEFALLATRNARWKGIQAVVVKVDLREPLLAGNVSETRVSSSHWVVGFPTSDEGWKFMEPQDGSWINIRPGGMYLGKEVEGLSYLRKYVWEPIEEVK